MKSTSKRWLRVALGLAVTTISAAAPAQTGGFYDGTLSLIEYGSDTLLLQMPSTPEGNFVAQVDSPCGGIPGASLDTQKIWASMAQAAILSGKSVRLYWAKCSSDGAAYITTLDLFQ
jgi:hypothetical protein